MESNLCELQRAEPDDHFSLSLSLSLSLSPTHTHKNTYASTLTLSHSHSLVQSSLSHPLPSRTIIFGTSLLEKCVCVYVCVTYSWGQCCKGYLYRKSLLLTDRVTWHEWFLVVLGKLNEGPKFNRMRHFANGISKISRKNATQKCTQ